MKKHSVSILTLTLATLVSASFGINQAYATTGATVSAATVSATVMSPITLSETTHMNFGKVAALSATAGTVVLDTSNSATSAALKVVGTAAASAVFTVGGDKSATYAITLPSSASTITGGTGSDTMTVDTFVAKSASTGAATTGTIDATSGSDTFNVGATLHVAAGQGAGSYSGTYSVSVDYN